LVFIFPLWLGMLPAILKGFLERVMQPDVTASKEQSFPSSLKASPHGSLLRWECLA
jgi:putative NADPH-quinone reductase